MLIYFYPSVWLYIFGAQKKRLVFWVPTTYVLFKKSEKWFLITYSYQEASYRHSKVY